MIKSPTATAVVTLAAAVTAGVASTASQLVNSRGFGASGAAAAATSRQAPRPSMSAQATPPPKRLTVGGALNVQGLAPGVTLRRAVIIGNANNQDVELQSVRTVLSGPSPAPSAGTCSSPADFEVIVDGYNVRTGAGTPVTIRKNSSLGVPVTVRMNNRPTNQDSCKGKSWTFTFVATATSK